MPDKYDHLKRITDQCNEYGKPFKSYLEKMEYGDIKAALIKYLSTRSYVIEASTAKIYDYVKGEDNSDYCIATYSDGEYIWTSNDILYIEKYNMKISEDFISHVLKNTTLEGNYTDKYEGKLMFEYASDMYMVFPKEMLGRDVGEGSLHIADDYIIFFKPGTPEDIKQKLIKEYAEYYKTLHTYTDYAK